MFWEKVIYAKIFVLFMTWNENFLSVHFSNFVHIFCRSVILCVLFWHQVKKTWNSNRFHASSQTHFTDFLLIRFELFYIQLNSCKQCMSSKSSVCHTSKKTYCIHSFISSSFWFQLFLKVHSHANMSCHMFFQVFNSIFPTVINIKSAILRLHIIRRTLRYHVMNFKVWNANFRHLMK